MKRERDTQRSKVYAAEWKVIPQYKLDAPMTRAQADDYVKAIYQRERVRARFPRWRWGVRVEVNPKRRYRSTAYTTSMSSRIVFAAYHLQYPMMILHEVAHCLSPLEVTHGPVWVENYLWLVRQVMGREAHDKLKAALKAGGVRVKPKVKRNLTEAQRQVLRDRLAAVRQRKLVEVAA